MTGLRVGLVCPYSFDRPGGVQNHVLGLAEALRGLGHHPAVLAPGDLPSLDPDLDFTSAGPALPVPYNGSIARVSFGPVTAARVRRWLRDGGFDLIHLHEPITPSISLQALRFAEVPVVATYHTATPRSRTMQVAGDALRRLIEKIDAGIAVSEPARDVVVRHLGRDPVVIPNGFDHASFLTEPFPSSSSPIGPWRGGDRPRVTFLGRLDESRKGLPVLLAALPAIRAALGDVEICLAGHGTPPARAAALLGCRVLGGIDESAKRDLLARTDVFVAPQVARESFGIVVLEAFAAGAEVVASDLPAFVDLLRPPDEPPLGRLFRRGDAAELARRRRRRAARGRAPAAPRRASHDPVRLVAGRAGHHPGVRSRRRRIGSSGVGGDRPARSGPADLDRAGRRLDPTGAAGHRGVRLRRRSPRLAARAPGRRRRAGGGDRRRTPAAS